MRRRDFIKVISGAAAAWPLAARGQQPDRVRRIGVLMGLAESDPEAKVRAAVFERALQELGWTRGRNIRIDFRWAPGDVEQTRAAAAELLRLAPDVSLAHATPATAALQRATRLCRPECAHGWSPCDILQRSAWSPARHQNRPRSGAHLGTSPALVRSAKAESPKPAIVRGAYRSFGTSCWQLAD